MATILGMVSDPPTAPAAVPVLEVAPGSTLALEGDSTLHRYQAKARSFSATAVLDSGRASAAGPSSSVEEVVRAQAVVGLAVVVAVAELRSDEPDLDTNLHKALRGDQHREIRFDMLGYDLRPAKSAGARFGVRLRGRLTIAGVARDAELSADAFSTAGGLRFSGHHDLLMTAFGIKPPRLMLGALKVADRVRIRYDLELRLRPADR